MDFAANAIADFTTPPPAPAAAKATDATRPSFNDHLQAARDARDARHAEQAEDSRAATRSDQADRSADRAATREDANDNTKATSASEDQTRDTTNTDQRAPHHTERDQHASQTAQTPAPLLVQLMVASAQQTQPQAQAPLQAVEPVAVNTQAVSAEVHVITAETKPATTNANTAKKAPARDAKTAKAKISVTTPEAPAPQAPALVAASTPATTPQAPAPQVKADAGPPDAAAVGDAGAHDIPTRVPKADAHAGAKFEAPTPAQSPADNHDGPKPPPTAGNNAKPATSTARETIAAAQTADAAPSAPTHASTPAPVTAQIQMPMQAQHVVAEQAAQRTAPVASQVGHEIVRRFDGGNTSFDIRLDPPELGRVDVRLDVSRDHRVTATISADNPQALHELARHARDLAQTLQSAGLELTDNGLSFDLRQGSDGRQQANRDAAGAPSSAGAHGSDTQPKQQAALRPRLESWRGVRLDMMV